jgi:hypothetical protein
VDEEVEEEVSKYFILYTGYVTWMRSQRMEDKIPKAAKNSYKNRQEKTGDE